MVSGVDEEGDLGSSAGDPRCDTTVKGLTKPSVMTGTVGPGVRLLVMSN
jgi:hypothetical protein